MGGTEDRIAGMASYIKIVKVGEFLTPSLNPQGESVVATSLLSSDYNFKLKVWGYRPCHLSYL